MDQEGPLSVDAVLAIAKGEPMPTLAAPLPEPPPRPAKRAKPPLPQRARALVGKKLKEVPKPESSVRAAAKVAAIPERSLIVAAHVLGVRTQRRQWRLPG